MKRDRLFDPDRRFLSRSIRDGYRIEARGRNGEPLVRMPVTLTTEAEGLQALSSNDWRPIQMALFELAALIRLNALPFDRCDQLRVFPLVFIGSIGQRACNCIGRSISAALAREGFGACSGLQSIGLLEHATRSHFADLGKHLAIQDGLVVSQPLAAGSYRMVD